MSTSSSPPPWQELWLGFDPSTVEANLGSKRGIPSLALGLVMNLVCSSAWGAARFDLRPECVWGTFVVWALGGAYGLSAAHRLNRPGLPYAAIRGGYLLSSVAYGASFGASSSLLASPTYAMGLVTASACGAFLPARSPALLGAFALTPLALRLTFVPSPSPLSCLVALSFGLIGAGIAGFISARLAHDAQLAQAVATPVDPESAVRLALLTAIHDHLSGLLLVARTTASTARDVESLRSLLTQIAARGADLVGGLGHADLQRAGRDLDEIARSLGGRVTLSIHGPADELPDDDRRQLVELASEATLNALRARPDDHVALRVDVDEREVRFRSLSSASESPRAHSGRGLRYARLRAALRGGSTEIVRPRDVDGHAKTFVLRTRWPRAHGVQRRGFPRAGVTILAFLAPATLLAIAQDAWWPLALSAYATLSAAVLFEEMRRAGRELEDEARRALAEVDAGLAADTRAIIGPRHEALLAAMRDTDLERVRVALRDYAEAVRALLTTLEEPARDRASETE